MSATGTYRSGTSGMVFTEPNKKAFPPAFRAGSRLDYYSHLFNSLEVNSSFYKVPLPATFEKWAAETPEHFQFTIKLWKGITHVHDLAFDPQHVIKFMQAADRLGNKKGCLLVQLPPGLTTTNAPQLQKLLELLRAHDPTATTGQASSAGTAPAVLPWKIAVEFRHPGWYTSETYRLLKKYNASVVLHDMPASLMVDLPDNSPFVYLRFHGINGDYRGAYTETYLVHQAFRIRQWLSMGSAVYAYFNNTIGDAVVNCQTLNRLVTPCF